MAACVSESTIPASTSKQSTMEQLAEVAKRFVSFYMRNYNASHGYQHVHRVLGLARTIQNREESLNPTKTYRTHLVALGSIMHDLADQKYLHPGHNSSTLVGSMLKGLGADEMLAAEVQYITSHVSYSYEVQNPDKVQECLRRYPELGIIQDADRIDGVGAVGIGRCFVHCVAAGKNNLDDAIELFEEKLQAIGKMKTMTGRAISVVQAQQMRLFVAWWEREMTVSGVSRPSP